MSAFANSEYDIEAGEAYRLVNGRDAQIIDVRERYEREAGHIPGDRYLDMQHVALETDTIDRERPVIFYCRGGIRSGMTTVAFRAAGWEAYNLRGGLLSWTDAGHSLEPSDGTVAEH